MTILVPSSCSFFTRPFQAMANLDFAIGQHLDGLGARRPELDDGRLYFVALLEVAVDALIRRQNLVELILLDAIGQERELQVWNDPDSCMVRGPGNFFTSQKSAMSFGPPLGYLSAR